MDTLKLKEEYNGLTFKIIHCKGATESFYSAMKSVDAKRKSKFINAVVLQIRRLADGHRMSKENFPIEGTLPKRNGQQNTKHFNALKRIPIRGYCWLSETEPNTYYISHYIYKDRGKLDPKDTAKVGRNWRRVEEDGYEC